MTNTKELGVVAIAKNEEKDLPGFLSNLINWVDEIVIVDNESTDATEADCEICWRKGDCSEVCNARDWLRRLEK